MVDLTTSILPYKGTGIFELDATHDEIKSRLESHQIQYDETSTSNVPPWTLIDIFAEKIDVMRLAFAKNRLFEICLKEGFKGRLPNGIRIGMHIDEAINIDKNLTYNDDNDELFESPEGYWLDYYRADGKIFEIIIFIPALERDDFFEYKW